MDLKMSLLKMFFLFTLLCLVTSEQITPIKEEILDSTSQRELRWTSTPSKAWQEIRMKLGQDTAHTVYQSCDPKSKNQPRTLWTNWLPRNDAHELLLDLQFAQDDQTPVIIQVLESDAPLVKLNSGQERNEAVAPSAFALKGTLNLKDVEEHLYHAENRNLGMISRQGFYLGFTYRGSCVFISSVRLFYTKCPGLVENHASFGEASAGSGMSRGQCVDGAEERSAPLRECHSNGTWSDLQGSCVCRAGYQSEGNICTACKVGSYKPANDSGECRPCPANSRTLSEGASECDCEEGHGRLQSDPPHVGCTRPPTAPLNLTIHQLSDTALILSWAAPADLGGRVEVLYDVECRQNTGQTRDPWQPCGNSTFILPQPTGLTETVANITGLHVNVNYQFSVRATNRISAQLDSSGSVQSITVLKTPVQIPPAPVATAHFQVKEEKWNMAPMIAGVVSGVLLLLALIPAAYCFLRRGYSKLRGDHDAELVPLQTPVVSYRRTEDPETATPQETNSAFQVLDGVSERLLCGIRDVLVDRSRLTLGKELGKGEFGAVYEGVFSRQEGENIKVAVKTMRVGIYSHDDLQSFLKEAEIMQHFDHENVVKLLGVTLEREEDSSIPVPLVILPFLKHGDLRRFLIATRYGDIPMFVPHQSLLRFMVDIATGMEYLSSKGFLHRDLAARNCMLGDDLRVRVADFGLSKQIFSSDYYRQRVVIRMPIKWMALESLSESIYTSKSDVWSFGVTMWEIVSRGRTPYPGIPNHELLDMLEAGHRLKQGECDDKLYEAMLSCWHREPSERPCFTALAQRLKALLSELPPLEASMEAHYINQGLEAASANQSSTADPEPEGAVGNLYLPSPVSCVPPKQQAERKEEEKEEEGGYMVYNKSG
ncbi:tyrosine-protein kinase receptor TYRO3-like [Astyanax mexicanus]|uniref:receptor protein-tyrosine kinase n=1 Tax=Astyanax mexicanus TaxID=7994 RepID=A0A8T2LR62_ASTMX|nr:tyrosine-protein kinase receptor TYRO3-like [Astyanax mexicanus]